MDLPVLLGFALLVLALVAGACMPELRRYLQRFGSAGGRAEPVAAPTGSAAAASSWMGRGRAWVETGDAEAALAAFQQAARLARSADDKAQEATALHSIGIVYAQLDDCALALQFFDQALALYRQIGDDPGAVATLNSIGLVQAQQGSLPQAIGAYTQSLALAHRAGGVWSQAHILLNLGLAYSAEGDSVQAIACLEQAVDLFSQTDDRRGAAQAQHVLGKLRAARREREAPHGAG